MTFEKSVSSSIVSEHDSHLPNAPWAESVEKDAFLFPDIWEQYDGFPNDCLSLDFEEDTSNKSLDSLLGAKIVDSDPLTFQHMDALKSFSQVPRLAVGEQPLSWFSDEAATVVAAETSSATSASAVARTQSNQASNNFSLVYQGIANIAYGVINPLTNSITSVFRKTAQVISEIANPQTAAGIVESNPFSLSIGTTTQDSEGDFSIFSALPFDGFLAQYWQLKYDPNTAQFIGELTDSNTATALAVNGLIVNEPLPGIPSITIPSNATMREGSMIAGTITNDQMQFETFGFASGLIASSFVFQITASLERTA